ncbi:BppU family phage baseplate upper protein [Bifidobacterium sp. 82T10]|uniref:BppU family phage baseplate upper protein n=1 Tax=Bifidobacterium miconis TaxID=2834435 RepID=A0ABS6WGD9_9BIFI|nr:BppU family phage baseplate upper protein [Bifidobacterium miconis]MBW3093118.1 BppU family phage baseplate upper protein [Bifidobacterium miconis]
MASLDEYRTIDLTLDSANDWLPSIRLNAGDEQGRKLRVAVTDQGVPVPATGLTASLQYNLNPGTDLGFEEPMTAVSGADTATFEVAVPRRALSKVGRVAMGVRIAKGPTAVMTRTFDALVERAVYDPSSPDAQDKLDDIREAIDDLHASIDRANRLADSVQITIGTVSTLDPAAKATATLTSGWPKTLNLGLPKGHDGANADANGGVVVQDTTPDKPVRGQIWMKTNDANTQIVDIQRYDGSKWTPYVVNTDRRQVFSVPVGDKGRAWFDRRGYEVDCWVTFEPFTTASISSAALDRLLAPQMPGVFPTVTVGPALSVPIGVSMPALDATAIGPQMMLQIADKLVLTRVDSKTAMPALASGRLYYMHIRYRATNEMTESKPVYFTQLTASSSAAASTAGRCPDSRYPRLISFQSMM